MYTLRFQFVPRIAYLQSGVAWSPELFGLSELEWAWVSFRNADSSYDRRSRDRIDIWSWFSISERWACNRKQRCRRASWGRWKSIFSLTQNCLRTPSELRANAKGERDYLIISRKPPESWWTSRIFSSKIINTSHLGGVFLWDMMHIWSFRARNFTSYHREILSHMLDIAKLLFVSFFFRGFCVELVLRQECIDELPVGTIRHVDSTDGADFFEIILRIEKFFLCSYIIEVSILDDFFEMAFWFREEYGCHDNSFRFFEYVFHHVIVPRAMFLRCEHRSIHFFHTVQ